MLDAFRLPRQRFWLLCLAIFCAAESVGRIVLMTALDAGGLDAGGQFNFLTALGIIALGVINDLAIALVLGVPFLIGLHILPSFWRRGGGAAIAHGMLFALLTVLVFGQVATLVFWNEFDSRFNSIAVNYLIFPREVVGAIRESFDMRLMLIAPAIAACFMFVLFKRHQSALATPVAPTETRRVAAGVILVTIAAGVIIYLGPLGFGKDREQRELAANGTERLLTAALTNNQEYDGLYLGMDETAALRLVHADVAQDNTQFLDAADARSLRRHVTPAGPARRLNVVLVLEESFGSLYVNSMDNKGPDLITPNLDRLSENGLLFTNIYATGNRTVNALEAIFTSFSPLPGISTARRPGAQGMYSLPGVLNNQGYNTAFLYGGRKAFDNMGNFWSGIGFTQVWDQNDIATPGFTTIWGVADEYLFGEGLARADALAGSGKPFFLSMLTVSNHRPYTYPAGRIDKDPAEKRRDFSAAYADWAFGNFIERAQTHAWFNDTIFIFIGDHGPRVFGAATVPVPSFRVPLLMYAPAHIEAKRDETLGSSLDVAPTLLGLLGLAYDSPFFGVDLARVPVGRGRVVMQHNFNIAMGDGRDVAIISPGNRASGYAMQPGPFELTPRDQPDAELLDRIIAQTQTAHRMFYARQYHAAP